MTHPNASTAMAEVVLDELSRHGIRHVVIAPGSRSAALAIAAVSSDRFDVHIELDERSAGFLALGIGRSTGTAAVVITTSGTAVANLHPAAVEADLGVVPLILVTADRPPELRDRGANQTIDQRAMFGSSLRWEFDPGPAEDLPASNAMWRSMVSRAVAASNGFAGRPGPVHLNLPFREPLVPASDDGRTVADPFTSPTDGRPSNRPWTVASENSAALAVIEGDPSQTLVVVGDVAAPGGIDPALVAVTADPHSGSRSGGTLRSLHFLASHPRAAELTPDAVLRIGRTGLSRQLDQWLKEVPTTVYDPHRRWIDPAASASAMLESRLSVAPADRSWLEALLRVENAVTAAIDAHLDALPFLSEPRVARDTARAVRADGALVVASSMPIRDTGMFMCPMDVPVHANRGASGIDGFVSTALGVAIGSGRPTVALAGDLSMLHDSNGLLLHDRPNCVFVVVDNDGGGIFSFLPQANHPETFEAVFGTPHGRDFSVVAAFHGVPFRSVTEPNQLVDVVREMQDAGGVSIVSVRTDRNENVAIHREITRVAHDAIDTAL